jgi:hypothetical protein
VHVNMHTSMRAKSVLLSLINSMLDRKQGHNSGPT